MAVFALAGCSDPKTASESNFKAAMQNYLDTAYPRCYFVSNFPAEKESWDVGGKNLALATLEQAGLLGVKEVQHEEKQMFSDKTRTVTKQSYDLTAEGRKYYKAEATKNLRGEAMGGLCAGKATVTSIGQFTEPADMMGLRISRVNYSYTVADLPAWAMRPDVQKAIRGLKEDAQSASTPVQGVVGMALTNNGWVHEKMLSQ
jgi:hypothetical protein